MLANRLVITDFQNSMASNGCVLSAVDRSHNVSKSASCEAKQRKNFKIAIKIKHHEEKREVRRG